MITYGHHATLDNVRLMVSCEIISLILSYRAIKSDS